MPPRRTLGLFMSTWEGVLAADTCLLVRLEIGADGAGRRRDTAEVAEDEDLLDGALLDEVLLDVGCLVLGKTGAGERCDTAVVAVDAALVKIGANRAGEQRNTAVVAVDTLLFVFKNMLIV